MRHTGLQIDIEPVDGNTGRAILHLTGEIDLATVDQFRKALDELADQNLTDAIIDASQVGFMDSTGLHALVKGKERIHGGGARIALIASPPVRRVLELIFPDPLFAARVDTMEQAREALGWMP